MRTTNAIISHSRWYKKTVRPIVGVLISPGFAYANCGYIDMPPVEYDFSPRTAVHLEFRDYYEVDKACRTVLRVRVDGREEACGGYRWGAWWIILPRTGDRVSTTTQMCLLRHEFAHLNGWLPTHPDARFE
jgi:hypothetical protein